MKFIVLTLLSVCSLAAKETEVGIAEFYCKKYMFNEHGCKTLGPCFWTGDEGACVGKSQAAGYTHCVDGIVDRSRSNKGKMSKRDCKRQAVAQKTSFTWGNGNRCYVYGQKLTNVRSLTPTDGLGYWVTCTPGYNSYFAEVEEAAETADEAAIGVVEGAEESVGTMHVGNLPEDVDEDDLSELFGMYGSVKRVQIPVERETGTPKGYGYVEMETPEEEAKVVRKLDGAEWMGRDLKVNIANNRSPSQQRGPRYGGRYYAEDEKAVAGFDQGVFENGMGCHSDRDCASGNCEMMGMGDSVCAVSSASETVFMGQTVSVHAEECVVYGFAVFGLGFLAYGAGKHFFSSKADTTLYAEV